MKTSFPLDPFLRYFAQKRRPVFVEKSIFPKPKTINPGIKQFTTNPEDSRLKVSCAAKPFVFASNHVLGSIAVTASIAVTFNIGYLSQKLKTVVAQSATPLKDTSFLYCCFFGKCEFCVKFVCCKFKVIINVINLTFCHHYKQDKN